MLVDIKFLIRINRSTVFILVLIMFLCTSCAINRMEDNKRVGHWVEQHTENGIRYESQGHYYKGEEDRKWRYYENGRLVKKERYHYHSFRSTITYYHANGQKSKKGKTKQNGLHWSYDGAWNSYDKSGKHTGIMTYEVGELIREQDATGHDIPLTPLIEMALPELPSK